MACPQSCTHACVPRRPSLPQASFTAKAFCRPACQRHLSKSNQHIWKWNDLTPGPVKIKWNNFWQQCVERTCERSEGPFATFKLLLDKTEYSLKRQECFRMVPIHSIPGTHPQSNIQFLDHETCVCHNTRMNDRVYIIYTHSITIHTWCGTRLINDGCGSNQCSKSLCQVLWMMSNHLGALRLKTETSRSQIQTGVLGLWILAATRMTSELGVMMRPAQEELKATSIATFAMRNPDNSKVWAKVSYPSVWNMGDNTNLEAQCEDSIEVNGCLCKPPGWCKYETRTPIPGHSLLNTQVCANEYFAYFFRKL